MPTKPKIIVILGPTASGKSALAIDIAKKFTGEVISADSRQVYQGLNIGSNKVTQEETEGITHHLLDVIKPDQDYSLHDWQEAAFKTIEEINKNHKVPIICGGTGLYLSSILQNYQIPKTDLNLRKELEHFTLEQLIKQLEISDPEILHSIDIHNKVRVLRALEYTLAFKASLKNDQKTQNCPFDYLVFGLDPEREALYTKIDQRVEQMIATGLIDEVKQVYAQYQDKQSHALSGIGYKEIIQYLDGKISLEEAENLIKKNTHHYAKRQMTWFRRMEKQGIKIHWNLAMSDIEKEINNFLK
ncbi:MAG: tRNA dimethylallyltransferase [Patescibacteria group bacterium]|nr:tRNA dimethylallyltransferase [Patescibacteria group bacterium]MDQ5970614.1 tRNA dimethylallyltransferase [Patescibacteria group bacterium]